MEKRYEMAGAVIGSMIGAACTGIGYFLTHNIWTIALIVLGVVIGSTVGKIMDIKKA